MVDLEVRPDDAVVGVEREGQLALVPVFLLPGRVRHVGHVGLGGEVGVELAERAEEPDVVLEEEAAERELVLVVDLVEALRGGERGLGAPLVVSHGVAVGGVELVAARLGQHVDDAAGEAAVFSRHVRDRCGGLLNRVLDVQRGRRAADVIHHRDAVDHEQVLVRDGARNRHGVGGAGVGLDAGRHQGRLVDRLGHRELVDQRLLVGGRGSAGRLHGFVGTGDRHLLGDLGLRHRRVDPLGLRGVDLDRGVDRLETLQI